MKKQLLCKTNNLMLIMVGALIMSSPQISAQSTSDFTLTELFSKNDYSTTWNFSAKCRDMAISGDNLYIIDNGKLRLRAIDKTNGNEKVESDILATNISGYSVSSDSKGNMFATEGAYGMTKLIKGGTIINNEYQYKGSTSVGTCRYDYISIYGDISNSGLMATSSTNTSDEILLWNFQDGSIVTPSSPKIFKNIRNGFKTGASVSFADDKNLWVSGQSLKPILINFENLDLPVVSQLDIPAPNCGGIKAFTFCEKKILAIANNQYGEVLIYDVTSIDTPVKIGTISPKTNIANTSVHLGIDAEVTQNNAIIYIWAPNNGLAAYKLSSIYPSTPVIATSDVVLNDDNTDINDLNITASWAAPTNLDESVTITGYTVELYKGTTLIKSENATSSATSAKFSSVTPGEEYTVKLTVNYTKAEVNKTSEITSATITPDYAAAPVTNAKVTLSKDSKGNYGALIDFDKPTVSGGTPLPVSKYIIRRTGVSDTPNDIEVPSTFVRKIQTVGGKPIDYVHIDIVPDQPSSVSYLIEAVYGATNANITKKASVDVTSTGIITGVEDNITVTATKIYPNPTDGQITINSAEAINRISIYSVTGAMVKEFSGNISESQSVDLRGMAPGIYFVKVNNLKPIQIILK